MAKARRKAPRRAKTKAPCGKTFPVKLCQDNWKNLNRKDVADILNSHVGGRANADGSVELHIWEEPRQWNAKARFALRLRASAVGGISIVICPTYPCSG